MLVLTREKDETIMVGDDVEITICDIRGDSVRLGIRAPRSLAVHRREVWDKIQATKDPYEVVIKHTDPTEIKTALALAERKLARINKKLKEAEYIISKFSEWSNDNGCPVTETKEGFCPDVEGQRAEHEEQNLKLTEEDRFEFDSCECDTRINCGKCYAEYYRKQYRDRQPEDVLMPDKGGAK